MVNIISHTLETQGFFLGNYKMVLFSLSLF